MKCTNKKWLSVIVLLCCTVLLCGCGSKVSLSNAYTVYATSASYGLGTDNTTSLLKSFTDHLAVIDGDTIENDAVDASLSEASLIVNLDTNEVASAKNIYEQLYPASTTKILTAYLVLENCDNLDDTLTVSENALNLESGSSVCGFQVGDVVTVRDALYGMMLCSGNEAAVALAEYISGDVDSFATLMNETATKLGATNSHFVNPNGLTDEDHYTTVYDLYIIFQAALENSNFYDIVTATSYTANYTDASGEAVTKEWTSTNRYIAGTETAPDGVTVLGGKTGTTTAAGSCLVLLSENSSGTPFISVVLAAETRDNLYVLMNELLATEE